jgi:hypothetical protein
MMPSRLNLSHSQDGALCRVFFPCTLDPARVLGQDAVILDRGRDDRPQQAARLGCHRYPIRHFPVASRAIRARAPGTPCLSARRRIRFIGPNSDSPANVPESIYDPYYPLPWS